MWLRPYGLVICDRPLDGPRQHCGLVPDPSRAPWAATGHDRQVTTAVCRRDQRGRSAAALIHKTCGQVARWSRECRPGAGPGLIAAGCSNSRPGEPEKHPTDGGSIPKYGIESMQMGAVFKFTCFSHAIIGWGKKASIYGACSEVARGFNSPRLHQFSIPRDARK